MSAQAFEFVILGLALLAVVVLSVVIMFVRRSMGGSGMRDFLGISVAFMFLAWLTFAMIVGEHALG